MNEGVQGSSVPVGDLVRQTAAGLSGSSTARLDAEILLAHVTGRSRSWILAHPEYVPAVDELSRFLTLCSRRALGEPVAYLTGVQGFWSFELKVTPDVLIPRPETELLVEICLDLDPGATHAWRVLDLGTGSGAIALALACERPGWQVTATEVSESALTIARHNAERICPGRVRFLQGSWFNAVPPGELFNVIVSNPPYIDPLDSHVRDGSLRYEPIGALVAEGEGLADLRLITEQALPRLSAGGWLLLEHGYDQGKAVRGMLLAQGYRQVRTEQDLAGLDRITLGRRAKHE